MSIVAWCWLAWIVVLSIEFLRRLREVLAMPGEWTAIASKIANTMEGDHGADEETR